jgi:lipopolysaccharide/colanic/teichoic acid biosynthesis glycosyltransferase
MALVDWKSSKRVFDVAVAGLGLLASAPVLALASIAIKLDSPGPVLFDQIRTGREQLPIRTLKLRTMISDADSKGPQITAGGDPRVTRVGRWLRRTKLDELPQLWNVLRGDMSLVGPRPEVPKYTNAYRAEWRRLFTVRPGITDLASLTFRDEEALLAAAHDRERAYREVIMPMKLELALRGVERNSLRDDLAILAKTFLAVVRPGVARDNAILNEAQRRIADLNAETRRT